jgi:HEPN domain-containing protein
MDQATSDLVKAWFLKALSDLETSQQLLAIPDGHLDAAIYHCQQAAEKAIKGWLFFKGKDFPKTHHLGLLMKQVIALEPTLAKLLNTAENLTPYAVAYRYPDVQALAEPTRTETETALKGAKEIFECFVNLIPEKCRPLKRKKADPPEESAS